MVVADRPGAAFHGRVPGRAIVPGRRIVSTEINESLPGAEAVNTPTLTEQDGRTTLTLLVQHSSQQNRDRHLEFGNGLQEALDYLEQAATAACWHPAR